jgi:hypothetical protein
LPSISTIFVKNVRSISIPNKISIKSFSVLQNSLEDVCSKQKARKTG